MKEARQDLSRAKLVRAFYFALGSYVEQEAKKGDSWRDQSVGQLYAHLAHEIEEIRRNLRPPKNHLSFLLHNCLDAVMLSTMLLCKVMDLSGLQEEEGAV